MKLVVGCTWCSSFSHTRGVQIHRQGCQISTCQWGLPLLVSSKFDVVSMLNDDATIMDNDDHVQQLCAETSGLVVGELRHEQHHALQGKSSGVFAGPRSSIASARRKPMAPKKKSEGPKVTKAPCFGHHQLEPPGREVAAAATISPSGSHAKCANSG